MYYCIINNKHVGPVSKAALLREGIEPDTPVFSDEADCWQEARHIPELMAALENRPFSNHFELKKYTVSAFTGGINTAIARLYLFDDYLVIDVFGTGVLFFGYEEICGYKNGLLGTFKLMLSDGQYIHLSSMKKKEIRAQVLNRRSALTIPLPPFKTE
ncbi:MAG: DUF4339 domain-containing protein [Odoribacter sp.]|nr:DUF4339 domain-containing protein [Odoribacter sp.]